MPGQIENVLTEMRKTHESLKEHVDKQIEEIRKSATGEASALTREAVDKVNSEMTELRKQYDDLVVKLSKPATGNGGDEDNDSEEVRSHKKAFEKYLRRGIGESGRAVMTPEEIRALSNASDKDGGFLVPTAWETGLLIEAYNDAEIRPLCNTGTTGRDTVQLSALSKPQAGWGTTNLAVSEQQLAAGGERMEVHDLRALVLIHNNTLDDSEADIWNELSIQFAMALAEEEDDAFAIAPGHNSPKGIASDARVLANFVATGVAGGLTDATHNGVDALIEMLYGLKKTYRRNASWAMNSTTEGTIRTLKNDVGDYLWQPPVSAGAPATLLGRPLANPEALPDVVANAYPIVLGDFRKGYKIRDRSALSISRLVERYAEYDHTGFLVKKRVAGQVTMPEAFRVLKVAA